MTITIQLKLVPYTKWFQTIHIYTTRILMLPHKQLESTSFSVGTTVITTDNLFKRVCCYNFKGMESNARLAVISTTNWGTTFAEKCIVYLFVNSVNQQVAKRSFRVRLFRVVTFVFIQFSINLLTRIPFSHTINSDTLNWR